MAEDKKHFYLKFNTKDYRTDHNVCNCSASANGVYVFLLCVLFESPVKGKYTFKEDVLKNFAQILPKQNNEQTNEQIKQQIKNICSLIAPQLSKHLPFTISEIENGMQELLENNVLYLEGNSLCQKRMIKDAKTTKARTDTGKKGGESTKNKLKIVDEANKKLSEELMMMKDLLKQKDEQINEQKRNYNYNYNNHQSIGNNVEGIVGGVGEEKGETVFEKRNTDPDYLSKNIYVLSTPETCAKVYFQNPMCAKSLEDAMKVLWNYNPDIKHEDLIKKLKIWATEFHKHLERTEPQGKSLKGKDSYQSHFHNWLLSQKEKLIGLPESAKPINPQIVKQKSAAEIMAERGVV